MSKIADLEMDMQTRIANVHTKIESHEAVCAERWRETIYRIKRLELLILTTLISLVVGMATILSGQVF